MGLHRSSLLQAPLRVFVASVLLHLSFSRPAELPKLSLVTPNSNPTVDTVTCSTKCFSSPSDTLFSLFQQTMTHAAMPTHHSRASVERLVGGLGLFGVSGGVTGWWCSVKTPPQRNDYDPLPSTAMFFLLLFLFVFALRRQRALLPVLMPVSCLLKLYPLCSDARETVGGLLTIRCSGISTLP